MDQNIYSLWEVLCCIIKSIQDTCHISTWTTFKSKNNWKHTQSSVLIDQYSRKACYIQLFGLHKGPRYIVPFFGLDCGLFSQYFQIQPETSLSHHPVYFLDSMLSVPSVCFLDQLRDCKVTWLPDEAKHNWERKTAKKQSDPLHSKIKPIPNAWWTIPITAHKAGRHMCLDFQLDITPHPRHHPQTWSSSNKAKMSSVIPVLRCVLGTKPCKIHWGKERSASILKVLWGEGASWLPAYPRLICPLFL